jgi:hypothetical protein
MIDPQKIHPSDVGLPEPAIRNRQRSRRVARIMLTVCLATAIAGWTLYSWSVSSALRLREQPFNLVIVAYALLIVSSVTLILGLWYLLLAQVERVARMVDAEELEPVVALRCHNCGWTIDAPDRFCRHCGKALLRPDAPPTPSPDTPRPAAHSGS